MPIPIAVRVPVRVPLETLAFCGDWRGVRDWRVWRNAPGKDRGVMISARNYSIVVCGIVHLVLGMVRGK